MAEPQIAAEARYRNVDEARIVEMLLVHGWRFDVALGRRAAAEQAARAALEGLVALGLPYRQAPAGGRLFDPVETWNFVESAGLSLGDRTWEDHCVAAARRQAWEADPQADPDWSRPPALEAFAPQHFAVTIWRTFNLNGYRPGDRVRLRLPLPIADPTLRDVSFEFLPPQGVAVETQIAPARLDAILRAPEDGQASIGVRAEFTACPALSRSAECVEPAEAALYIRPSEGLIKVSARVSALAAELAGHDPDPLGAVRRFWDFVLDELACGAIHYDALDPASPLDWVLAHGWYDCQAGSALLTALCRARDIPARLVTGYMLHLTAPAFHTWMEAWIEGRGWVPLDLACWELALGGRDADWRDYYFGRLDHRMVVERLPRLFSGPGAVRLPPAWRLLVSQEARAGIATFEDVDTGALVYRERIEVERLDQR
ncbi:MAG: transglutaminase family protein [Caulobacterales bacterium]